MLAYADDIAISIADEMDIVRAQLHLNKYNAAIAGATNWKKSKAILAGPWKKDPPLLPMKLKKAVEYLGGIVGHDRNMIIDKWIEISQKLDSRIERWSTRVGSSVQDRMLVIKLMFLSLLWYHASVMAVPVGFMETMEEKVLSFLWNGGVSKVRKAQLYRPKKEGGLGFWSVLAKSTALRSSWVVKYLTGKLSKGLTEIWELWTVRWEQRAGTHVPLWESQVD